ncbi:TPA: hypothetical protein NY308_001492 [Proteus mirabilis]|uniref:hypothetical protein n=1 Tax=Proteus mirabilis TaxID=584 RepID=UPI000D74A6ED|nr:hypothetical protein [Proteus mirabilis]AWR58095.1 hypothetical protein CLH65_01520 [Proteus mirabilis]EKW0399926.1 hypothetical protein [Proteus mirabilis]EKW4511778.1 hypothetical protein [Proteus mirabilis]MBG3115492.1 hypothetical protein [Proteus mirabilis]MCT0094540.1 hypothetical protein [Proteus mirabilis]
MILIIYFITILFIGVWIWSRKNKFALNEESLHKQWLFWLAILFPLFSSLYFMLTLGFGYPPNIDIDGFNNFLNMHKFSLGILTLSPILGAFVVSAHRSYQTDIQIKTAKEQLEQAQKKNQVDLYFSIKKNIIEELDNIKNPYSKEKNNSHSIYNKFYKKINHYEVVLNDKHINSIEDKIEIINSYTKILSYQLNEIESESFIEINKNDILDLYSLSDNLKELIEYFGFVVNERYLFLNEITDFEEKILLEDNNEIKIISYESDFSLADEYTNLIMLIFPTLSSIARFLVEILHIIFPDEDASNLITNLYYLENPE